MTSIELSKELNLNNHRDLVRTLNRLRENGLKSEIIPDIFRNKMNREYKMYNISERVVNIVEGIYLFSGKKESELIKENKMNNQDVVYFITDGENIKIGHTSNITNRIAALQIGNAKFIEVVLTIDNASKDVENSLHKYYNKYHLSGEWFSLDYSFINHIKKEYKDVTIHDTLGDLIFEFWHLAPDDTSELTIEDFIDSNNYRVKRRLRSVLSEVLNNKTPYKEAYQISKDEVNKLADSLNFNRKSLN